MILRPFALALALLGAACAQPLHAQPADGKPQSLPVTKIRVGGHAVDAEVASTPPERQVGLMYRFSLPADRGMLFVFAESQPLSFWMRNTYVPLSIAYIDAQGRILNIEELVPQDERSKWSAGPALYALEMRKGWFAQKGIRPGAKVDGLPPASKE